MASINLITALKLIRFNHTDSEVGTVLQAAIDELERLQDLEKRAANLASLVKNADVNGSIELAIVVSKLAKVE